MAVDAKEAQYEKIRDIVCDVLEIDEDELTLEGRFSEDYGADSLRAIEILGALEQQLGVVIDQSELARMVDLQGVNDVVAETAGWR